MAEQDKLNRLVDALRKKPEMTNEEIAQLLGLRQPRSAISWKVKAWQMLQSRKGK